MSSKEEIENFKEYLKNYGTRTLHNILSTFLIWLFGVLVFIPLAGTISWQTRVFCTLIFFVVFTLLVLRTLPSLRKLIVAFSVFPARKYSLKKGISYENSLVLFRYLFYIVSAIILYLLYFPFLAGFHPAISGIVLIMLLIWIFFLALRILLIFIPKILGWLCT